MAYLNVYKQFMNSHNENKDIYINISKWINNH